MDGCSFSGLFGWHGWPGAVFLLLLVAGGAYGMAWLIGIGKRQADRRDSLELLKRRLAAGEISLEEFKTLRQYL